MEYVDGVDLKALLEWRRRIGKRVTDRATRIYIIMEICKGLSYAHELTQPRDRRAAGHRPPRHLAAQRPHLQARARSSSSTSAWPRPPARSRSTDPGVVKGKMSYLSPEAARGEEVDHRADIFAVGILLYEMLTGKRLFYGETDYQTVELVRNAKIPPHRGRRTPRSSPSSRRSSARRWPSARRIATRARPTCRTRWRSTSFSRGLKVISRDIAELVRQCLDDKRMQSGEGKKHEHRRAHPAGRAGQVHLGRLRRRRARSR